MIHVKKSRSHSPTRTKGLPFKIYYRDQKHREEAPQIDQKKLERNKYKSMENLQQKDHYWEILNTIDLKTLNQNVSICDESLYKPFSQLAGKSFWMYNEYTVADNL